MKPLAILAIGGISLAATLTLTSWLSARATAQPVTRSAHGVPAVRPQEAQPSSTNRGRYHHHSRKWSKQNSGSLVRSGRDSE